MLISSRILMVFLLLGFLAPGCSKKETAAPPAPVAPAKAVSLDGDNAPPPPPPPPPAAAVPVPDGSTPDAPVENPEAMRQRELLRVKPPQGDGEVPTQKALIWAVDRWEEKYPVLPKDVNELVAKGLLKPLPPPPAGKKYRLDAHNRELTLVDK